MRWPKMMAGPGDHWVPRLLLGVGVCFDHMWTSERLLYTDRVRYVWSRAIHRPSMESGWCVDHVFPYKVYIHSNHHNSWI
jgi:hypothetical protein